MANKCGHCNGTGTCRRGRGSENSCDSCRGSAGYKIWSDYGYSILVKCEICGGTGWI